MPDSYPAMEACLTPIRSPKSVWFNPSSFLSNRIRSFIAVKFHLLSEMHYNIKNITLQYFSAKNS